MLTQPPSESRNLRESVTITCTGSSSNIGDGYNVQWYQQVPGKPPKTVIYGTNSRPSGIPDRFSGSRSGSVGSLTITGLKAEDEADYYCQSYDKSLSSPTVLQGHEEVRQKLLPPAMRFPGAVPTPLRRQLLSQFGGLNSGVRSPAGDLDGNICHML